MHFAIYKYIYPIRVCAAKYARVLALPWPFQERMECSPMAGYPRIAICVACLSACIYLNILLFLLPIY